MKKALSILLCLASAVTLLAVVSLASAVEFEDGYVKEGDFVLASFNGTKPFYSDLNGSEAMDEACYWLGDVASSINLKYVSFIGDMSSGSSYSHQSVVVEGKKTLDELYVLCDNDEDSKKEFKALKNSATMLSDMGIPYGVSIGLYDYYAYGLDRRNHVANLFDIDEMLGEGCKYQQYDVNNFAITVRTGNVEYIIYQLEAFPRAAVIAWFNGVQSENLDKRAIIYTTSFLDRTGEMYTQHNWTKYPSYSQFASVYLTFSTQIKTNMINMDKPHDGDQLWLDALSSWDNLLAIVSANASVGTDILTKTLVNNNGNEVLAVVANLDGGYGRSGNAYPLLMKISADNKTIDLRYAVPFKGYEANGHTVITMNKLGELQETDPVSLLPKVAPQINGENKAYINGYEGNIFKPNNNMTKAEACTIFARLLLGTQTIPDGYTTRFTDVKKGDWYYNAIAFLDETGYFFTNESDVYEPNSKITRAEFVELAYFASNLKKSSGVVFNDVEETNKYYDAILAAAASGLVNGYGDGSFKPNSTITRAEVVTVINRLISVIVTEETVSRTHIERKFNDISGHWAELQVIMASNDNVRGDYFYSIDKSDLKETATTVYFENDHFKAVISKRDGKVTEFINKVTGENAIAPSVAPWFSYIINASGANVQPVKVELEDGRLKFTYKGGITAYFIVDVRDDYFSVMLDTDLPKSVSGVVFGNLSVTSPWELDNENAFGLSGIAMTTTVNNSYVPGGESKMANGVTYTYLGVPTLGAKVGIAYSRMTEHRDHLKSIVDDIDPAYGITSKHGGPYALDNPDVFGDYVILQSGLYADTATETARLAKQYSVDQLDIHQGGATFIHGSFNFVCARTAEEWENDTFITAAEFKKRIADKVIAEGVQLGLHTYSSLVSSSATNILSDPYWQKQFVFDEVTYTLRGKLSKARTNIKTVEDASGFITTAATIPWNNVHTKYILIDDEIILVQQGTTSGFLNVKRGQLGTVPQAHEDGAVIRQFLGWYGMLQTAPLSELFYKVAEDTAKAYNEGGFEMIYLDGLESFAHEGLYDPRQAYYIYAEFVRTVVSNCDKDPLIEYSAGTPPYLWNARARGGATDHARRAYKNHKTAHVISQSLFHNYFYTATVGWFNYAPDDSERYKDTTTRTLYRDDLDHMGSLAIAHNFSTVCQPFSVEAFKTSTRLANNFMYYGLYSRLREANYFSPEVKKAILDGEYEYKVFRQEDGTWAFREMKYFKNKVLDMKEAAFTTGKGENPFDAQTPFIRIEQRYSTLGENPTVVKEFDENLPIAQVKGSYSIPEINVADKPAFRIRVYGNGSETDAILISLKGVVTSEAGRNDLFIPLDFTGWREIILIEANNDDYEGYSFEGIATGVLSYETYRAPANLAQMNKVTLTLCGSCNGVRIDDLVACTPVDAPVKAPSVKIGSDTITFDTELHSSEYVEYYPEYNKAYLNYYTPIYNDEGVWVRDEAHVKEISFSGSVTVPSGKFTYTYGATPLTDAVTRAQVVIGVSGNVIENPEDWTEPKVDMPSDIEKVPLC